MELVIAELHHWVQLLILDLSGNRCDANVFSQLFFINRTILIEILQEKIKLVVLGFWLHIKISTLMAVCGNFILSKVQCKKKNSASLIDDGCPTGETLIWSLKDAFQPVVLVWKLWKTILIANFGITGLASLRDETQNGWRLIWNCFNK